MSEFVEILLMILCGISGMAIVSFFQIQGINDSNPNITFKQAIRMYFSKTAANTIASFLFVVLYSCTHEEWITFFNSDGVPSNKLIKSIISLVMIMSFLLGGAFQYGIYKVIFRKIDLAMKRFNPKSES